jgi:glycerophosphoryl diester phosphodiesterase
MKKHALVLICILVSIATNAQVKIDIEGHRGCRGLLPENTIPAFIKAVDIGVTTLEMDVVITKDNKVVVSHEAFLNHEICKNAKGEEIKVLEEKSYNIYKMDYAEVKQCDCGTKVHPRFKEQQKVKAYKPLLEEVIDTVEKYIAAKNLKPVKYNIEIKSELETDNEFHPIPSLYTDMVYQLVKDKKILDRVILQSFDVRVLQYIHQQNYPVKTAFLVENLKGFDKNISLLDFAPDIYSPYFKLVNEDLVTACHKKNIQLIPWTVNDKAAIERMLKLKVDGLISDYPDKVIDIIKVKKQ